MSCDVNQLFDNTTENIPYILLNKTNNASMLVWTKISSDKFHWEYEVSTNKGPTAQNKTFLKNYGENKHYIGLG